MDRVAGREQPRPGSSLALLGGDRLATGWFDLRDPAFRDTSVATPCANVMGHLPSRVAGCRGLLPFSTASLREIRSMRSSSSPTVSLFSFCRRFKLLPES